MTDEAPALLITGAAGDIGSAVATELASTHRLILADHAKTADRLAEKAGVLRAAGASVLEITFDVTNRADVSRAFDTCEAAGFAPTRLFNNAGYQGSFARIDQMQTDDVEQVMAVNVVGVFNVIAECSARMISAGTPGSIVNTASMAGVSGAPNMAGYSASKAAVVAITKSAAKDLAPFNIRVNAVSPAFIGPGAMWERQVELQASAASQYYSTDPAEVAAQMINMVPLRRYGSTAEVASVVAFLLSDAASYLTAVNIEISGGSS